MYRVANAKPDRATQSKQISDVRGSRGLRFDFVERLEPQSISTWAAPRFLVHTSGNPITDCLLEHWLLPKALSEARLLCTPRRTPLASCCPVTSDGGSYCSQLRIPRPNTACPLSTAELPAGCAPISERAVPTLDFAFGLPIVRTNPHMGHAAHPYELLEDPRDEPRAVVLDDLRPGLWELFPCPLNDRFHVDVHYAQADFPVRDVSAAAVEQAAELGGRATNVGFVQNSAAQPTLVIIAQ